MEEMKRMKETENEKKKTDAPFVVNKRQYPPNIVTASPSADGLKPVPGQHVNIGSCIYSLCFLCFHIPIESTGLWERSGGTCRLSWSPAGVIGVCVCVCVCV